MIGEDVLPPISQFNNGETLNWVYANADFDTSGYADKYLTFWVVVWMQTADGKLVAETPGHGLTALPGPLKNLVDASQIEEKYDNNGGFYPWAFYVSPQPIGLSVPAGEPEIRLSRVDVSSRLVKAGEPIEVSALFRTGHSSLGGLTVSFYDGDPADGGKLFDVERIPFIRARQAIYCRDYVIARRQSRRDD